MRKTLLRRAGLTLLALSLAPLGTVATSQAAHAAALTNAQALGMKLATPAGATTGSYGGVKVYTYSGVRCVLNDNQSTALVNTAGGWTGWTFKVDHAGTFGMKVWCSKGTVGAALATSLTVTTPLTWKTDVSYSGRGPWTGPVIRLPRAVHRLSYYFTCDTNSNGEAGFAVAWTSANHFEYDLRFAQTGSGVYTVPGGVFADSGTILTSSPSDCDWKVAVQSLR
ncbi:MAG: hypothetical protein QOJ50_2813 [Cryptosporangiaceae bacterium]|nr:hypothetical protein [Cryptosporangiaceae bacterium]